MLSGLTLLTLLLFSASSSPPFFWSQVHAALQAEGQARTLLSAAMSRAEATEQEASLLSDQLREEQRVAWGLRAKGSEGAALHSQLEAAEVELRELRRKVGDQAASIAATPPTSHGLQPRDLHPQQRSPLSPEVPQLLGPVSASPRPAGGNRSSSRQLTRSWDDEEVESLRRQVGLLTGHLDVLRGDYEMLLRRHQETVESADRQVGGAFGGGKAGMAIENTGVSSPAPPAGSPGIAYHLATTPTPGPGH